MIEFESESAVRQVFDSAQHFSNDRNIPFSSRHLYFRPENLHGRMPRFAQKKNSILVSEKSRDDENITGVLKTAESVSKNIFL